MNCSWKVARPFNVARLKTAFSSGHSSNSRQGPGRFLQSSVARLVSHQIRKFLLHCYKYTVFLPAKALSPAYSVFCRAKLSRIRERLFLPAVSRGYVWAVLPSHNLHNDSSASFQPTRQEADVFGAFSDLPQISTSSSITTVVSIPTRPHDEPRPKPCAS